MPDDPGADLDLLLVQVVSDHDSISQGSASERRKLARL